MPSLGSRNLLSAPQFLGEVGDTEKDMTYSPVRSGLHALGLLMQGTQQEDLSSEPSAATNRAPCHWGGSRSVPVYTSLKSL